MPNFSGEIIANAEDHAAGDPRLFDSRRLGCGVREQPAIAAEKCGAATVQGKLFVSVLQDADMLGSSSSIVVSRRIARGPAAVNEDERRFIGSEIVIAQADQDVIRMLALARLPWSLEEFEKLPSNRNILRICDDSDHR
jgi:hypothetical protein